jgi:Zn-finger nucleic acid-binding protein
MTQLETRYPCPVCLGATLKKSMIAEHPRLTIDHCPRCGGVWFDYGEVQQLRRSEPKVLWELVAQREAVHQMQCHACQAFVGRSDEKCAGCGRANVLDCPKCGRQMAVEFYQGMRLDACTHCRGVWFDRHELDAIWRMEMTALQQARQQHLERGEHGAFIVLDALMWDPITMFYGAHVLGEVAGAAPELVLGAGEVVAEAAGSVFETIVEIISGIFG